MDVDGPELRRVAELARDMTVVVGFCEADGGERYNSAAIVTGDGVIGVHRKVHQPLGENLYYAAGDKLRGVRQPGRPGRRCSSATTRRSRRRPGRSPSTAPR